MSSIGMLALTLCEAHSLHARAFSSEPDNNQAEESNNDDEREVQRANHLDTKKSKVARPNVIAPPSCCQVRDPAGVGSRRYVRTAFGKLPSSCSRAACRAASSSASRASGAEASVSSSMKNR